MLDGFQLAQQGSLAPLIAVLLDKEEVVSRYAAMCVTNLACDPSNQVILIILSISEKRLVNCIWHSKVFIAKLGGLPALIEAASLDGTESSRYSGMALVI